MYFSESSDHIFQNIKGPVSRVGDPPDSRKADTPVPLQSRVEGLEGRVSSLEEQLKTLAERVALNASIYGETDYVQNQIEIIGFDSMEAVDSPSRIEKLESENARLKTELGDVRHKLDGANEKLSTLEHEKQQLETSNSKTLMLLKQVQEDAYYAKQKIASMNEEIEADRDQIVKLRASIREAVDRESKANIELKARKESEGLLLKQIQDFKSALDAATAKINILSGAKGNLEKELGNANSRIQFFSKEADRLKQRELPCQDTLLELQKLSGSIPPSLKSIAESRGYNFTSLPAFLASCGKIENLRQLWEACANQAKTGAMQPGTAVLLKKLLEIFNAAFPENQARLVYAEIGEKYRYEEQDRGASNGEKIAEVILPGMRTPGGTLVKCVVRLN